MEGKCKMSGKATTWPCSARACPLFFDCLIEYEAAAKPQPTNGDRIRAMSDEELAVWLMRKASTLFSLLINAGGLPEAEPFFADWLQQPAEEG